MICLVVPWYKRVPKRSDIIKTARAEPRRSLARLMRTSDVSAPGAPPPRH
jgi:hypothetical protein